MMRATTDTPAHERRQYVAFGVLSLGRSTKKSNTTIVIWLCIVFVSSLDPVFVHIRMGSSSYVGVFVFVFTLVELYVFRRYDFISMYLFWLVFYVAYHLGYLRLRWLF